MYDFTFRFRGEIQCFSVSVSSVRCGTGNTSACMLSVSRVAACRGHLTQIRDDHSCDIHEDLMSQQFYGSAAFHFCPTYFDSQSAVQSFTCVSCGCCVLSWQQHCVPPSLCWVGHFQQVSMCVTNGFSPLVTVVVSVVQLQVTLGTNQPNVVPHYHRVEGYTSQVFFVFLTMAQRHLTLGLQQMWATTNVGQFCLWSCLIYFWWIVDSFSTTRALTLNPNPATNKECADCFSF